MSLSWKQSFRNFETYLRLEKSLSENSVEAYLDDVHKLERYFTENGNDIIPVAVSYSDLKAFLSWFGKENNNPRTQSRVLSGVRAYY